MDVKKEVKRVMSELKSVGTNRVNCSSSLYGALIMMRTTLIKSKEAHIQLIQAGCIPLLLDLLSPAVATGNWLKTIDIVISILANMCLEEEAREQVISNKGLSFIVEATKSTEKESIHNRGVRAVANMIQHSSKSDEICEEVFDLEFHIFVAKRLMETKEKECKQTYLRAVRLLGQRKSHLIKLVDGTRSVQAVAVVLKEDDEKLKHKSLRILHEFSTLRCCGNFAEQILAANILEELVQAAESHDDEISSLSLFIILKLCEHENIRPPLGAAGLIPTLMRLLDSEKSHINHISLMNALCLCCFEAVNRHRLYQEKTLELFMSSLGSDLKNDSGKFSVLQDRIISCLVCFLYNDECFDKLLDLGLVKVISGHLKRVCNLQTSDDDWGKEVELILNETKREAKEITAESFENDSVSEDKIEQDGQIVENTTCAMKNKEGDIGDANVNCTSSEILSAPDHLDHEIMDISMEDTEVIHSSGMQDSRHTFSIDSPTYQMEQHSWRLEDHTSGITCKNYAEDPHQDDIDSKLVTEGGGSKFSPYSPLSAGSSYYSPAYPSPAHSFGSSPRHSNFQTGSFRLGSQSPQSSPTWSASNSLASEDNWSTSSDQGGRSPANLTLSPNRQQGQFSPLINPYPASPPPIFSSQERNICESPLHVSQVSNVSNRTIDSQEDIFPDLPKHHVFSEDTQQGSSKFSCLSETLNRNNHQNPIYSASEEEDEEDDSSTLDKSCKKSGQNEIAVDLENAQNQNNEGVASSLSLTMKRVNNSKGEKDNNTSPQFSAKKIKSVDIDIELDNEDAISPISLHRTTNVPFVRLNSEPHFSILSLNNSNSIDKQEPLMCSEQSAKKILKQSDDDSSFRQFRLKGSMSSGKKLLSKQLSFPGSKVSFSSVGNISPSPHSPPSSSPLRMHYDFPFNSPSMSPFSRYSNSPYASPNPHHLRTAEELSSGGEIFRKALSKNEMKLTEKKSSSDKRCQPSSLQSHPSCSSTFQELSPRLCFNLVHPNSDQPSSSKSGVDKDKERVNRIKRKTEENVLVLMSRISIKTNPSTHLPKYDVLSTLTKYIAIVPTPLQRCMRTLFRLFHNPHCFESVLLEQAPALIVKNLILDQDGRLPSVLFKDQPESKPYRQTPNREIIFDELLASSQSSETPSDFELQIQFEFGGDAYSDTVHQTSFCPDIFQPHFFYKGKSLSHCLSKDNSYLYSSMTPEDLIRIRIRNGINLMKAITSLALSRYGDGEIQRLWSRGTESEKLMCAVSLLHMPIGCGPLHRHQIILKHGALHQVIPLLFCKEAPLVRESIVTALSLLAHLFRIKKTTPNIPKLKNTCPVSISSCIDGNSCSSDDIGRSDKKIETRTLSSEKLRVRTEANDISCNFEKISDKLNLNLIVQHSTIQERKVFKACKEILMKKSEVFCAMLGGGYAEADKVDIEFSDVNLAGFEYILHFLHGCESGCAVIDSLSLVDSKVIISDCDNDSCLGTECNLESRKPELNTERKSDLTSSDLNSGLVVENTQDNNNSSKNDQCNSTALKGVNGNECLLEEKLDQFPSSSSCPLKLKDSELSEDNMILTSSTSMKQIESSVSLSADHPSTSSASTSDDDSHMTKQVDFILDKCIDIMTVADRFLIHDLIPYLTSVLSHTCLYTRTVTDIIFLASTYKLTSLATDCIVEVLLSQTSQKDIAHLFQVLGVEMDSDMKKMLIDILINLYTAKTDGS